ncbi:MAG: PQQ-binding-like beta-propeller repeat protein [Candidatus Coatesbacteria bacterium]|nr:PQQ-binding-like beta-propeller repeat protein [Candidatus Coatesbacteria bacterium]
MRNLIAAIFLLSLSSLLFSAPGDLVWRFRTAGYHLSSPCVSEGVVYIGSGIDDPFETGFLYAINCRNENLRWKYQTDSTVGSSPCVSNGIIYIGDQGHYISAINCSNGSLKWSCYTGLSVSSPCVSQGVVYVGSSDTYLYAINCPDETLKWKFRTSGSIFSSPCVSDGIVYVGSDDYYLYAINCSDGILKWKFRTNGSVFSSPCVSDSVVYVGSCDHYLYAIEAYGYKGFKNNKSASYIPAKYFSVSPNPFSYRLSLSLPSSGSIYSLTGQLIMNLTKGKHSLDTSEWTNGVYIVYCGKETKKIIKID